MAFQEIRFQGTDIYIKSFISSVGIPCYFPMENFLWLTLINFFTIPSSSNPNTNFLLELNSRKAEISYTIQCESEPVKMPNRHFLRSDYLHIVLYMKFLLFVSLVHQVSIFNRICCILYRSF